jgi:hypothetical protein
MRTAPILTVARYLLLDRTVYLVLPWAWGVITFGLDVAIIKIATTDDSSNHWAGGLVAVFIVVFVLGVQAVARALPFGLALGVSRRTYFLGATTLAIALAVCFGAVVTIGQALERATGGWGINMSYFRVADVLDGAWWQSWLTASAAFLVLFAYGMWYGLVYRRNGLPGTVTFAAAQAVMFALLAAIVTWTHDWAHIGHFFASNATAAIPAILASLAVLLLAGGLATVRRLVI